MTDRRRFLTGLPVLAVGVAASARAWETPWETPPAPDAKAAAAKAPPPKPWEQPVLCRPVDSGNVIDGAVNDSFPHVAVTNQNGLTVPFYEAFIRDRIVMMNFMSIRDEEHLPVTARMAEIVALLGDRVGRDIHVYSITRDPRNDTPRRLSEFAARFDAPAGWQFLTASEQHCADLAFRMYRMGHSTLPGARGVEVVFYGNGGVGLWGAFPVDIRPEDAAERITWVMPRRRSAGAKLRRAGPRRFAHQESLNHNRELG